MGLGASIATILSSAITTFQSGDFQTVKAELYPKYSVQSRSILPPGIDSVPVSEADQGLIVEVGTDGKTAFLGTFPVAVAEQGEIRVYSRDTDGNLKASVHCKNNGDIEIVSDGGKIAIDNAAETLKSLMNNLITEIKDIVTVGSPTTQTLSAGTKALFTTLNGRINDLLKEA